MDCITTKEEFLDYLSQAISIDELTELTDLEYATIVSAGFEEADEQTDETLYKRANGDKLIVSRYGATLHTNFGSVQIDPHDDRTYYDIFGNLNGIKYQAYIKIKGEKKRLKFGVIECDLTCVDAPGGCCVIVKTPFVDLDDSLIERHTTYINGVVYSVEFTDMKYGWLHCLSGPAIIRGDKTEYYIYCVRMPRKRWLAERHNPRPPVIDAESDESSEED
jgi:hypothetical protein